MNDSQLVVDGSLLRELAARLTASAPSVLFTPALTAPADGTIGSATVASTLQGGSAQQSRRAQLVFDALRSVAAAPAVAASAFAGADAALARAF
ncbi:hypothetical protein [Leifsonia poae]|uniref:hypothetical protein n=1 Tax=Leifsonia poae TaxID=110933 RepID=UPI001CBAFB1B|nr:hypothetical protein [Leifsonia poae]